MDNSPSRLLQLPQELRDLIYHFTFDTIPSPGLLRANKSLHYETVDFVRERVQTFTYAITATSACFDDFSRWCFKIKQHSPRLCRVKHIVLNVYPPDPERPHEMWHIWDRVRIFSKKIGAQRRISCLTVNFMDTTGATRVTNGIPNATVDIKFEKDEYGYYNIEQIMITLYRFISNVDKPRLVVSPYYLGIYHHSETGRFQIETAEQLMTGQWYLTDSLVEDEYESLEYGMEEGLLYAQQVTGRQSRARFEKDIGRAASVWYHIYEQFKRDYPYMETFTPGAGLKNGERRSGT
ncbi:MAG: hypothetical protein Q9218_006403 [Villophora microphyllina]